MENLSVLRGPSRIPFESFPTPWSPFADSSFALLTDPLSPLVEIFSPFPTFGGSLLSFLQPLSGPSSSFVALRGFLFLAFVDNPQRFHASRSGPRRLSKTTLSTYSAAKPLRICHTAGQMPAGLPPASVPESDQQTAFEPGRAADGGFMLCLGGLSMDLNWPGHSCESPIRQGDRELSPA